MTGHETVVCLGSCLLVGCSLEVAEANYCTLLNAACLGHCDLR